MVAVVVVVVVSYMSGERERERSGQILHVCAEVLLSTSFCFALLFSAARPGILKHSLVLEL